MVHAAFICIIILPNCMLVELVMIVISAIQCQFVWSSIFLFKLFLPKFFITIFQISSIGRKFPWSFCKVIFNFIYSCQVMVSLHIIIQLFSPLSNLKMLEYVCTTWKFYINILNAMCCNPLFHCIYIHVFLNMFQFE